MITLETGFQFGTVELVEGNQANGANCYITASDLEPSIDEDVVGYIYELADETGWFVRLMVGADREVYYKTIDLADAQKWATDNVYKEATELAQVEDSSSEYDY